MTVWAQNSGIEVRHLSDITSIGQTSINDIYQDENGCMWFATREGVLRYNGISVETILPQEGDQSALRSPIVTVMSGDRNGHVFFGAGQIHTYDIKLKQVSCCWPHLFNTLTCGNGLLYIANAPYIIAYSINSNQADTIALLNTMGKNEVNRLEYHENKLYIGTSHGDVFVLKLDTLELYLLCSLGSCVSVIKEDERGRVWIGTWQKGLFCVVGQQVKSIPSPCSFVRDLLFYPDHSLWIGTMQGLYRMWEDGSLDLIHGPDRRYCLTNQSVWRIYSDQENTIWIGTYFGGVDYINPLGEVYPYFPLPLIDGYTPIINSVVPINETEYFLCSEGDGLLYYNIRTKECQQFITPQTSNIKSSYYDAGQHCIYLGLHMNGLCSFDIKTKTFTHYPLPYDQVGQNHVLRDILPIEEDLLCGTYFGVWRFSTKTKTFTSLSDSLNHLLPLVCDLKMDKHYCLWVVGNGVCRYDMRTGQIESHLTEALQTTEHVCVVGDKIYFGTSGYGVWESGIDKLEPRLVEGIKNKFVHNMLLLPNGNLLIISTDGVALYNPAREHVDAYSYAHGMPLHSLYNGACSLLPDGTIMLVGMDGITFFPMNGLPTTTSKPHIVFDNIRVNDHVVIADSVITLSPHSMMTMDICTDLYYNRPNLRYSLSSWNKRWIDIEQETSTIRLLNLPVGKHVLYVQALTSDNKQVLSSRNIYIRQRPPFYFSKVAIVLYLLLVLGGGIVGVHYLKQYYQRKVEYNLQQQMLRHKDALERISYYINENAHNDQFNVEMIVDHVGVSRTKLFAIVKASTGLTPNELILQTRMKKAVEMLLNKENPTTIAEIGYQVGFSSPKYFAKCFKDYYQMSPSEYRKLNH